MWMLPLYLHVNQKSNDDDDDDDDDREIRKKNISTYWLRKNNTKPYLELCIQCGYSFELS